MINRVLIRVKVVQAMYSYSLTREDLTLTQARKDLEMSMEKSYELYMYLFKLMIELTDMQERVLDDARNKFLPTEEDLNPNTRFVDNWLVKQLRENAVLNEFFADNKVSWVDETIFKRLTLDKIVNSDIYRDYMGMEKTDVPSDCEVWRQLLRHVILADDDVIEKLEQMSLFWSTEDVDTMGQFAIKTIKRFQDGVADPVLPIFRNEDDSQFGDQLFKLAVETQEENNDLIDSLINTERWDKNRVALMDRLIMCVALAEIRNFDSIPTTVSMNEYIELAKLFSSPQSGQFVNGILNAAVKALRSQGAISKP